MFVITSDIDDCITFASEQDALNVRQTTGWTEFSAVFDESVDCWILIDTTKPGLAFYVSQLD